MAKKKKVRKEEDRWLFLDFLFSIGELLIYVPRLFIGLFRNIN